MQPVNIALLKMGDLRKYSSPDYDELIISATGLDRKHFSVYDIPDGNKVSSHVKPDGIIISGSSLMVTDKLPWKEPVCEWLQEQIADDIPILGICFGHHLLAQVLGGKIGDNPEGIELGTIDIHLNSAGKKDQLLSYFYPKFKAQVSHVQSVIELPEKCVVLASSAQEPIQAFRYGHHIWGIQFHPEFDEKLLTEIVLRKAENPDLEINVRKTLKKIESTKASYSLLRKFAGIVKLYN
ncbi:MAG: hypothetical protein APR54_06950 [Candidatus Cloacimonas sp. SDB]|nr:MAG: hypothetical protein APR54_06950 [Candidatus Cloacimonas sp. SDB]